MFKGLKSKLEDEAKKLQASVQSTVAQYGESLSQQVGHIRTAASDAGSESGSSVSRRFFGTNSSNLESSPSRALNYSVGNALMEEIAEGDLLDLELPLRERRASEGSNHSNESSMSTLFASVPGMASSTLDVLESDLESTVDEPGSAVVKSASKEQISSVLFKLQDRAANYKDKYRDLVKRYNEVVTENNKCRTVLAQTQDKALQRIEKLRNEKKMMGERLKELQDGQHDEENDYKLAKYEKMLKKCTEEIRKNRTKITEIMEENEKLKHSVDSVTDEAGVSDLARERVIAEWKSRVEKLEEEWTERLNKADADSAIALAQAKADMHLALEAKDREVESLRAKCRSLEIQDGQANERWQKKVDDLKELVAAMEAEKSDMVEKLSEAKIQGVKAVRDDEEKRREELLAEFASKESVLQKQIEEMTLQIESLGERLKDSNKFKENAEKLDKELREKELKHAEELKKLHFEIQSLEERQRENEELEETGKDERVKEYMADVWDLEEKLRDSENRHRKEMTELQDIIESASSKHKSETSMLIKEHEEIINLAREQAETQRKMLEAKYENAQSAAEALRSSNENLEYRLDQLVKEGEQVGAKTSYEASVLEREINEVRTKLILNEAKVEETETQLRIVLAELEKVSEEKVHFEEELERMKTHSEHEEKRSSNALTELSSEIQELKRMLEERNEKVRELESERESLEVELAGVKELASMHEHLRDELQEARRQRDEVEVHVLELQKRAEKAEQQLKEDRSRLAEERAETDAAFSQGQINSSEDALIDVEEIVHEKISKSVLTSQVIDVTSSKRDDWSKFPEKFAGIDSTPLSNKVDSQLVLKTNGQKLEQEVVVASDNVVLFETEKKILEEKIVELNLILNDKDALIADLNATLEEANNDAAQLQELKVNLQKATEASELLYAAQSRISELESEHLKTDKLLSAAHSRLQELDRERAEREKQIKSVEDEKEKISLRLADMEREKSESNEKFRRFMSEKEESLRVAEKQRENVENELTELKLSFAELQSRFTSLEREADGDKAKLNDEIKELKEHKNLLENEIQQLNQHLKEVNTKLLEKTDLEERLQTLLNEKTSSLAALQGEKNELQAVINVHIGEIEKEKKIIENLESALEKAIKRSNVGEVASKKVQDLEKELAELKSSEEIAQKEIKRIQQSSKDKEKIIENLRSEVDKASKESKNARDEKAEGDILISGLKENLAQTMNNLSEQESVLEEKSQRIQILEKEVENITKKREMEKEEEDKLRIQYSSALESVKKELSSMEQKAQNAEKSESECEKLRMEIDALVSEYARYREEQQADQDNAVAEIKRKAETKLGKLKSNMEKDVAAAKAELLLQIDELRSSVLEKERLLDDVKIEKAKIEQQLIGEEHSKKELSDEKNRSNELAARVNELERRVSELTASSESARKECEGLRERRKELEFEIEQLKEQVKTLENTNEEGFKRAAAKLDADGKKVVRELQREVKHLYVELTEKAQALDAANLRIKDLESSSPLENNCEKKEVKHVDSASQDPTYMSFEEIEFLKKRLADAHREINELRETYTKNKGNENSSNNTHDEVSFAEPTEAEYLRNVLFRYMNERETLGKEIVTLTRVIGTVARFSKPQLDFVIAKEESRVATWGQTLQGAVQATRH